jgi:prolyl oligopeptidase
VLYWTEGLRGEPRVPLDPNGLSDDGGLLAYGVSSAGSDWQEWRVRNVETGEDTGDLLRWTKLTTASWTKDDAGFYYSRYDEPTGEALKEANYYQKLYHHKLGEPQTEDKLIYKRDDEKEWRFPARTDAAVDGLRT